MPIIESITLYFEYVIVCGLSCDPQRVFHINLTFIMLWFYTVILVYIVIYYINMICVMLENILWIINPSAKQNAQV